MPGRRIARWLVGLAGWLAMAGTALSAVPAATALPAAGSDTTIDVGYGVLATPMSVLGELMRRDRVLAAMARAEGLEVRFQAVEKGVDTLGPMLDGRLDASMPTDFVALDLIAKGDFLLVGYVRQSFSSVIGPRQMTMADLRGKRIGNASGTSGHSTLLQGLAGAGLKESDVTLVQMPVRDMRAALLAGQIDAFAAWEPTPSAILKKYPGRYKALHRQISPAYFVVSRRLADTRPEAVRLLIASLHRAVRWMSSSRDNLDAASRWTLESMSRFTGGATDMSSRDIAMLTQSDLLEVAGAPLIPRGERSAGGALARSLDFFHKAGKIDAGLDWPRVEASFDKALGERVLAKARQYRLNQFDYQR